MNKTQFRDLLQYLTNRPQEAIALRAVLDGAMGKSRGSQENTERGAGTEDVGEWLTAKQVGARINQCSRWVRDRLELLPAHSVERKKRGCGFVYMINYTATKEQLEILKTK